MLPKHLKHLTTSRTHKYSRPVMLSHRSSTLNMMLDLQPTP